MTDKLVALCIKHLASHKISKNSTNYEYLLQNIFHQRYKMKAKINSKL